VSTWWGGRVVAQDDCSLTDDRGLLLGDGLFETALVLDGVAPILPRHLARLGASATKLGIRLPAALGAEIGRALPELFAAEGRPNRAALRITVTRGRGRGLAAPSGPGALVVSLSALPEMPRGAPAPPVSAVVLDGPRVDPLDPLAGHKTLSAMPRVHARRLAVERGADVALLATVDGDVCEADAANLLLVVDSTVVTAPLDRGVLPGITRARCLDALQRGAMPAQERVLTARDLLSCGEAFLTSSLDGVRPLSELDGRPLQAPGRVATALAASLLV
jgi:branched-chain amino acid aminotransferase